MPCSCHQQHTPQSKLGDSGTCGFSRDFTCMLAVRSGREACVPVWRTTCDSLNAPTGISTISGRKQPSKRFGFATAGNRWSVIGQNSSLQRRVHQRRWSDSGLPTAIANRICSISKAPERLLPEEREFSDTNGARQNCWPARIEFTGSCPYSLSPEYFIANNSGCFFLAFFKPLTHIHQFSIEL